jgi:hypothetical protein
MTGTIRWCLLAALTFSASAAFADSFTIDRYNAELPYWGTSWLSGAQSPNGYYPSFYTGFAPRAAHPERIHVRLARGNQTRVTVPLDEDTLRDYAFDLAKRYDFYRKVSGGTGPLVNVRPEEGRLVHVTPHLTYFNRIVESDAYGILPFVASGRSGSVSDATMIAKGLSLVRQLNPGRTFPIRLDLTRSFSDWRIYTRDLLKDVADPAAYFDLKKPTGIRATVIALNRLLPGRVEVTERPSADLMSALVATANLAKVETTSADDFVVAAYRLFRLATGKKYDFRSLDQTGALRAAAECTGAAHCVLDYTEFTTIYPTGSAIAATHDDRGNTINDFSTPGLWSFVSRGSTPVDNIREEPYYGWIPKMDYEGAGNGFHNPGVRFWGPSRAVKEQLGIPAHHDTLWSVKRGPVSHGCSRLPSGHAWEMRHIFPATDAEMTKVQYFGSDSRDFDVFDVDGDGRPEVMGVEYLISYNLQGTDGMGQREGTDIEIGTAHKAAFYGRLYGEKDVFRLAADGTFRFTSPTVSLPSFADRKLKRITARETLAGEFPLYEQTYERDKIQMYLPITTAGLTDKGQSPLSKRIVRLMGRVRGCAPGPRREACGEAAFDREAAAIFSEAGVVP